ncbi:MAG: pilus assembly PilX N-terminal domain-containing protein [Polyangiaceae bacterium]
MSSLSTLKLRVRRRRESRGAIIFIVAMTLALLAAMGVYALAATSAEARVSGYQRQATQTHYTTEMGLGAAVDALSAENASYIERQMKVAPSTACLSTPIPGPTVSDIAKQCARLTPAYFSSKWTADNSGTTTAAMNTTTNLWGPILTGSGTPDLKADFVGEVTEPLTGGAQAGFDTNNGKCFRRFTISGYGKMVDTPKILSQEAARARVSAGPFDCGG